MNIKKGLRLIILMFVTIILIACQTTKKNNISKVEDILKIFSNNTDIDMDYLLNVNSSTITRYIKSKVVVKTSEESQTIYINLRNETGNLEAYYIDKYLYTIKGDEYSISDDSDFNLETEIPIPTDFDFTKINYKLQTKEFANKMIYTVIIEDSSLKAIVEKIIGQEISDMAISMNMVLTIDKKTNNLEELEYNISLGQDEETINIEILVKIKAIGDLVELDVPTQVTQNIDDYIYKEAIDKDLYKNTADGVVKYFKIGSFKKVLYDKKTSKVIVLRDNLIGIYNENTMLLENTIKLPLEPTCIDVDGGKLVVGYNYQYDVYNLLQDLKPQTFQTDYMVSEFVIDDDTVIYFGGEYSGSIIFHNLKSNTKIIKGSISRPLLTLNRKDHILYVTETGNSSSRLIYYNSKDGTQLYESSSYQFSYVKDRVLFDGKFIHYEGSSFNRFNGEVVSSSFLNHWYSSFSGFDPLITLYDSDELAFVGSNSNQKKIGIYDNVNKNFIYQFSLVSGYVLEMNDKNFLAVNGENNYIAVIDTKLIDEDLVDDYANEIPVDTVDISIDNKLETLNTTVYTQSVIDGNYIYTLNENEYVLNVYNLETLEKVYSERFLNKPLSLDANNGKLVIGFGDAYQFRIYNNTTWEYETVITDEPVYSTVIYKDRIIYSEINQSCDVKVYNMITKTYSRLYYNGYYISMAINREEGIIYFGDRYSSGCELTYFNLETNSIVYNGRFSSNNIIVTFDGNFVHFENATFDSLSGEKNTNGSQARYYKDFSTHKNIKTIFDDRSLSIFTALKDGEYVTVVYDLTTKLPVYTYLGESTNAYRIDNTLVILNNLGKTIRKVNLD